MFSDSLSDNICNLIRDAVHYSQIDWMSEEFYSTENLIEGLTFLRLMQLKSDSDCSGINLTDERFKEWARYEVIKKLKKEGFKRKLPKVKKFILTDEEKKEKKIDTDKVKSDKQLHRAEKIIGQAEKPKKHSIVLENVPEDFCELLKSWLDKQEKEKA